jgi:hypothetical protein
MIHKLLAFISEADALATAEEVENISAKRICAFSSIIYHVGEYVHLLL